MQRDEFFLILLLFKKIINEMFFFPLVTSQKMGNYSSLHKPEAENGSIIKDALIHGWIIEKESERYTLLPPSNFECIRWGAIWETTQYAGRDIHVPTYAKEESVRHTGTR